MVLDIQCFQYRPGLMVSKIRCEVQRSWIVSPWDKFESLQLSSMRALADRCLGRQQG